MAMEKDYFSNKVYCELAIVSDTINPDQFTKELGVSPHRSFCKGDRYQSKHSGSLITRPHNLWAVSSEKTISEEQDIKSHILQLKSILEGCVDELREFKNNDNVELTLWFLFETEDSGIGIDILEPEISFIHDITNRLHFSVIADVEIAEQT
jgi:hypothetical protein